MFVLIQVCADFFLIVNKNSDRNNLLFTEFRYTMHVKNIILFNPHNNVNFQKTKILEEIQLE